MKITPDRGIRNRIHETHLHENAPLSSRRSTQIKSATVQYSYSPDDASKSSSSSSNSICNEYSTLETGIIIAPKSNTIAPPSQTGTSAAINISKCICGAGSFALPHIFLEEGVLGGTIAMTICALLATYTIQSLAMSTSIASRMKGNGIFITSYVELAEVAIHKNVANLVFLLTLSASIGVCSTYLVFIGQTLSSLSNDAQSNNVVNYYFPNVETFTWEVWTALVLFPLSLLRNYNIFAFTSALGVFAVFTGLLVTIASGLSNQTVGMIMTLQSIWNLPLWPTSLAKAFGSSFGNIAYLFCVNFLTFPILNSMKSRDEYPRAVVIAVSSVYFVNVLFALLCLGFYGLETQDLILGNLDNGPYLSAVKLLLCVDLLFTFPIVFASGRQILEDILLSTKSNDKDESYIPLIMQENNDNDGKNYFISPLTLLSLKRAAIVALGVFSCFTLAQIGGFGVVANLVGGVAQGTLAFVLPPFISVALMRKNDDMVLVGGEMGQFCIAGFGLVVVTLVTYFTVVGKLSDS